MSEAPYSLACMEIWGGSAQHRQSVSVPGLDISVESEPHEGATHGGDLYYVSTCGAGKIARVAIADVSGHGETVKAFSAALTSAMRKSINTPDQSQLARNLNRAFEGIAGGAKFATALFATYFAPTSSLIIANAGHPPPMVRRAGSPAWEPLDDSNSDLDTVGEQVGAGVRDLPLGVIGDTEYRQAVTPLEPGDTVLLYTDACIEAIGPDGKQLGVEGFAALLARAGRGSIGEVSDPAEGLIGSIRAELDSLRDGPPDDDQTLLLITHNGAPVPHASLKDRARMAKRMMLGAALTGPGVPA